MKVVKTYRNDDQLIRIAEDISGFHWIVVNGIGACLLGPFHPNTADNTAYNIMIRSIKTWNEDKIKLKKDLTSE